MSGADDDARRIDLGELIEHVKEKRTAANWRQGLGNPSEHRSQSGSQSPSKNGGHDTHVAGRACCTRGAMAVSCGIPRYWAVGVPQNRDKIDRIIPPLMPLSLGTRLGSYEIL